MAKSKLPPFDNSLSEDEKVVQSFAECLQEKIEGKVFSPQTKEGKIAKDAILYPGAYIGAVSAIASFAVLRRVPVYIANRIGARQHMKNPNATGKAPVYEESPLAKIVGGTFDAAMAGLIGFTTWTVCLDKKKALMSMADIPLIEGKSDISDKLCGDFIRIYRDIRPNFWNEHPDDTIVAIKRFVNNCEKRQAYERRLRRETGFGFQEEDDQPPIALPERVPENILLEEKEQNNFSWTEMEDFDEEQDLNPGGDDDFWNGE